MYQIKYKMDNQVSLVDFIKLTKPKIVILLAITGGVAFTLPTTGQFTILELLIYIFVGYLTAGGSMAVNNAIDYDIDKKMSRTNSRISTGKISREQTVIFGSSLIIIGLIFAWLQFGLNTLIFLAWGGLFYIFGYSILLKRRTIWNTIIGGLASPAPVWGAYAARYDLSNISGNSNSFIFLGVSLEGWLLGFLVFLWTPSHTWAMVVKNYTDYTNANIPMLPIHFGLKKTAQFNLIAGIIVICYTLGIVVLINKLMIIPILLLSLPFLLSLLQFARNSTIEEGTRNFYAHNIWLGLVFLLLLF